MDNIFETIRNSNNSYSKKINDSKYTQNINTKQQTCIEQSKQFNSIYECILSIKDVSYQILNNSEKSDYIKHHLLELCNIVDSEYDKYNLNKKVLSKQKLCRNLQGNNNILSSILFYNEYFKLNLIIFNQSTNKFYKTGLKNYEKLYLSCSDKKWTIHDSIEDPVALLLDRLRYRADCRAPRRLRPELCAVLLDHPPGLLHLLDGSYDEGR